MTALVSHQFNTDTISQRSKDGYLHATAMCQAAGKKFNDYSRLETTKAYLSALSLDAGIPVSKLATSIKGRGDRVSQGTWVHPKVAIHLAQWLSPEFAVWCSSILFDWMQGKTVPVKSHRRRPANTSGKRFETHLEKFKAALLSLEFEIQSACAFIDEVDLFALKHNKDAFWAVGDAREALFYLSANTKTCVALADYGHFNHIQTEIFPQIEEAITEALASLQIIIDAAIKVHGASSLYPTQTHLRNVQKILRKTPALPEPQGDPVYIGDPEPVYLAG